MMPMKKIYLNRKFFLIHSWPGLFGDEAQIAITKYSGVGKQSFLLTAVDERIDLSVQVAMGSFCP
jgi:hypothetical protein